MKISDKGIEFLKRLEDVRSEMYLDSAGLPTIGVGHLLTRDELSSGKIFFYHMNEDPIKWKDGLTDQQINDLLRHDLLSPESTINNWTTRSINQHQYDALCCFVFNIGTYAFTKSTLLKKINEGLFASAVPAQMRRWIYSRGKKSKGLVNRREKEVKLWEDGIYG